MIKKTKRMKNQNQNKVVFTLREIECIKQAVGGKAIFEIAKKLGIGERSVIFYLKNGNKKIEILINNEQK